MKRAVFQALACIALSLAVSCAQAQKAVDEDRAADEKTVRDAGFSTDVPSLLDFFRKRILTDNDRKQFAALVAQLGADDFEKREQASKDLRLRGPAVLPLLKDALKSNDREVARRAKLCIEDIETTGPSLPLAAARLLVRDKPKEAVTVLLAFLPYADDDTVEEELLHDLLALTPEKGKAEPPLVAALDDDQPARRGAAGFILGRRGNADQTPAVRRLLEDKNPKVRYRAVQGLLAGRDKEAVPALLQLLEDAPPELAWQVEGLLFALSGDKGPAVSLGAGAAADRRKCRDEWAAWWKENRGAVDLAILDDRDRLAGLTLGIEYNTNRVWECGPDKKIRWEIKNLQGPMAAQVLPNGRVLIAESNAQRLTERDFLGNIKWEKDIGGQPTGCQRLPNGHTFVSTYSSVIEYDRAGKEVFNTQLGRGSNAIRKHHNGNIIYATESELYEVTPQNKPVRTIPLPKEGLWVGLQDVPGDHFLLANSAKGRVIEVDKTGKVLWEANVAGACGVWRLPNGHTLVAAPQRVVELDRTAKVVWETTGEGYVRRVQRR